MLLAVHSAAAPAAADGQQPLLRVDFMSRIDGVYKVQAV